MQEASLLPAETDHRSTHLCSRLTKPDSGVSTIYVYIDVLSINIFAPPPVDPIELELF